jgi:hypothetical protein
MKYVLFLIFSLAYPLLYAQVTITSSNLSVGDTYSTYFYPDTITSPGPSGPNVTWDFSTIYPTGLAAVSITSTLGYPLSTDFPTATAVWIQTSLDETQYEYINNRNPNLPLIVGEYVSYENPYFISYDYSKGAIPARMFPLTFNTSTTGSIIATFNGLTSSSVSGTRLGSYTYLADSYGTLNLGGSTFTDVIRTVQVQNYTDSANYPGSNSFQLINVNQIIYTWLQGGIKGAVFSISVSNSTTTSFSNGIPNDTSVSQSFSNYGNAVTSAVTGLISKIENDGNGSSITIYPNPSSGEINVSVSDNIPVDRVNLRTIDGSLTKSFLGFNGLGKFDVSANPPGLYIVEVYQGGHPTFKKLSIY